MERYFLREENDTHVIVHAQCIASSYDEAQSYFDSDGWMVGDVISESDWNAEISLNAYESEHC